MQDSLAGRAESIDLFGFSQGELVGKRERFVDRLLAGVSGDVSDGAVQFAALVGAALHRKARDVFYPGTRRPSLCYGNRRRDGRPRIAAPRYPQS